MVLRAAPQSLFQTAHPSRHETRERAAAGAQSATGPSAEQAIDLHAALARLDRADRELVVLKHLDGWTYEELAVRLEIPAGTVMSRLFNARRRLLALLGGERS